MDKILKRDDFIREVYTPMLEQKEYENLVSLNEGLLKTLFGVAKNLFKRDWEAIKGDPEIIRVYKEIDDSLSGFSIMKLSKKDKCNQIRQELVDFASDWYEKKMNDAKRDDTDPVPAKGMKFKDDTLRENLDAAKEKINSICGDDEQMKKWADTLLKDMKTVINRSILADIKDVYTNLVLDENTKHPDIDACIKALEDGSLKNLRTAKNDKSNLIKNDEMLGFKSIFKDADLNSKEFKTAYKLIDSFYTALNASDVMEKFNETPGQSVQAMCIAVSAFIKNCVFNDSDYGKSLPLMAKCAVISDGTVSYNLPLNDKTGDEAGNYFTDIIKIITDGQLKDAKGKVISLPDNFKTSSKTLLNKIVSEAKKLKETADKNYNDKLKSLKLGNEE